jgi:hypothetical protein
MMLHDGRGQDIEVGLIVWNGLGAVIIACAEGELLRDIIGVRSDGNLRVGKISEVIYVNSGLLLNIQQNLEGYLAWKWGLQANLPANHPYRYAAPPGSTADFFAAPQKFGVDFGEFRQLPLPFQMGGDARPRLLALCGR